MKINILASSIGMAFMVCSSIAPASESLDGHMPIDPASYPTELSASNLNSREFGTSTLAVSTVYSSAFQPLFPAVGNWLVYDDFGYRYRQAVATNGLWDAPVDLPNGALLCYMNLYAYDNDSGDNKAVTVDLRLQSGGVTGQPTATVRPEVLRSTNGGFVMDSVGFGQVGPSAAACLTINNNVSAGGAFHTLRLTIPSATSAEKDLSIRGVDLYWKRQISPAPVAATFSDVPTTHGFFREIEALKASGITSGTTPTTFNPSGFVTRGQMAAFLARALGLSWGVTD